MVTQGLLVNVTLVILEEHPKEKIFEFCNENCCGFCGIGVSNVRN